MKYCGECGHALESAPGKSGRPRLVCPSCGWKWYNPPVPVVGVVVTTPDSQVVYCWKRRFRPGLYSLVFGFVDHGERAEDAALREVREETGLEGEVAAFLGSHVMVGRPEQLCLMYWVRATGGALQAGDDVDAVELGSPDPARLYPGSSAQWAMEQFLARK